MRLSLFLAICLASASAMAQNNRSFVSTTGSDSNDCTAGHECRSFTRALAVTNTGGEVVALTSGGYGSMSITHAVSILAATGAASITTNSDGVEVLAGATDRVLLRGLIITLTGSANGVAAYSYGDLAVENVTVNGGVNGIIISGDQNSIATISDSAVTDATANGYDVQANAVLVRSRSVNAGANGLYVVAQALVASPKVVATEFVSVGGTTGVSVAAFIMGGTAQVALDRVVLSHAQGDGFNVAAASGANAHGSITNSTIVYCSNYGMHVLTGGSISSMKNNMVTSNGLGDTTGAIATLTGQ